ncbi:Uncharacterised protein [Elizabethkingia meningoseptica]|nr:Uncharacterised protein [Elizabethkingia meningoseptica]
MFYVKRKDLDKMDQWAQKKKFCMTTLVIIYINNLLMNR